MNVYNQLKDQAEIAKRLLFEPKKPDPNRVMCPICKGVFGISGHLEGVSFTQHIAQHVADHHSPSCKKCRDK